MHSVDWTTVKRLVGMLMTRKAPIASNLSDFTGCQRAAQHVKGEQHRFRLFSVFLLRIFSWQRCFLEAIGIVCFNIPNRVFFVELCVLKKASVFSMKQLQIGTFGCPKKWPTGAKKCC